MLTADDLKQVYSIGCFRQYNDFFVIEESGEAATLKSVKFYSGNGIFFNHNLLKQTSGVYSNNSTGIHFRKGCDGFVLTEHNGQAYLIWIELKSSFNEVVHKAVPQIAASYLKIKSFLSLYTSFAEMRDYREFAIAVSHSPVAYINNADVSARKTEMVNPVIAQIRNTLKTKGQVVLHGEDLGYTQIHNVQQPFILNEMTLKHIAVDEESADVDLGEIIDGVFAN